MKQYVEVIVDVVAAPVKAVASIPTTSSKSGGVATISVISLLVLVGVCLLGIIILASQPKATHQAITAPQPTQLPPNCGVSENGRSKF